MNQSGFSLIELMVATLVGLVVTLAVTMVYLAGIGTQRDDSDVTRLNETGRFAFDLLAREIRKAGYRSKWNTTTPGVVEFCGNTLAGSTNGGTARNASMQTTVPMWDGLNDAATINPTALTFFGTTATIANTSDVLRVRYYGEGATHGDGSMVDCQGYPVGQLELVEDTLYVAVDPVSGEPSLYCNAANVSAPGGAATVRHTATPLVTGVESLQLLYGEDTNSDSVVDRFVPKQLVGTMDNVVSIRISMVVRSPDDTNPTATSVPTFNHFSTTTTAGFTYDTEANADGGAVFGGMAGAAKRKRLMLSTEIAMRNRPMCK